MPLNPFALLAQNPAQPTPEEIAEQFEQAMQQFGIAAGEGAAAGIGALIVGMILGLIVFAVVLVVLALLIYLPYSKVPKEHQKMSPPAVFLMAIPLFGLVWNFIATARVSESFKSYFDSVGNTTIGDAGKTLGLWFSVCVAASFALGITFILACISPVFSIAALILFILYVVKLFDMAGKITPAGTSAAPVPVRDNPPPPAA